MLKIIFSIVIFINFFGSTNAANIFVKTSENPVNCNFVTIHIEGEILSNDSELFKSNLKYVLDKYGNECKKGNGQIILSSSGGDIYEAIKIGRLIRQNEFETDVAIRGECISACVLIFASGVNRVTDVPLGIHRPYLSNAKNNLSSVELRKIITQMNEDVRAYLSEMNISDELYNLMLSIAPEEVKFIGYDELKKYRLVGKDNYFEESMTYEYAKRYDLSLIEYRKRNQIASKKCFTNEYLSSNDHYKPTDCLNSVYIGVSELEAKRRREFGHSKCSRIKNIDEHDSCFKSYLLYSK